MYSFAMRSYEYSIKKSQLKQSWVLCGTIQRQWKHFRDPCSSSEAFWQPSVQSEQSTEQLWRARGRNYFANF